MADTQAIKDRIDIVQLIQEYLPLKKSGANWKANCPFHNEKSPSFMVHPEKQIWHCFGCAKGGDIFTFLQEIEGIDFIEALKILADRAGVKLENSQQNEVLKSQKNRIIAINSQAATFFHRLLIEMPAGKIALEYLINKRGLSLQTINNWQIGYIPDQWELLTQYMLKKGHGIDDLIASGLTIKNEERRSNYDRFRGRIMFPIFDVHGNVAGFTGRLLVEKEGAGGKYVNTPQSIVYDKSRILYGLNFAKQSIKNTDQAILVEGQMDVIACHSVDMKNVIASSGTALTEEQIKLIKRFTNNIAIAFDADVAGENAAKRGIDLAISEGLNVKVIKIPDGAGKDADECIKYNPDIWLQSVTEAMDIMTWYFNNVLKNLDLTLPRNKQQAADVLLSEIKKIPFAVEREGWIRKLSDILSVEPLILMEAMKKIDNDNRTVGKSTHHTSNIQEKKVVFDKMDIIIEKLFSIIVSEINIYQQLGNQLKPVYFTGSMYQGLYDWLKNQYNSDILADLNVFGAISLEHQKMIDTLLMRAENDYSNWDEQKKLTEAQIILFEIDKNWKKGMRESLKKDLMLAQNSGDDKLQNEILKKIMELT